MQQPPVHSRVEELCREMCHEPTARSPYLAGARGDLASWVRARAEVESVM